jgi:hypothetical protein
MFIEASTFLGSMTLPSLDIMKLGSLIETPPFVTTFSTSVHLQIKSKTTHIVTICFL